MCIKDLRQNDTRKKSYLLSKKSTRGFGTSVVACREYPLAHGKDVDTEKDYEAHNDFFVPHGHLSGEELLSED